MKRTEGHEDRPGSGQVRRFRRRLARLLVLERGVRHLAAAGFAWGGVVLACRAGLGAEGAWLSGGLVALVVAALAVAAVQGWRALPAEPALRALLDRRQGHGGLLMAGAETDLGPWRREMRRVALPRLAWRSGSAWVALAGAAAFLGVSFLVPARTLAAPRRALDVGADVEELAQRLEVLEEEGWLAADDAARLGEELETIAEEAAGEEAARAWEALDHLSEITGQAAAEAVEAAFAEGERLAAADEVAAALEDGGAASPELRAEALRELAGLTAQAAQESRMLDEGLAAALADAAATGDLGELRAALGRGRAELEAGLERLHAAGLIDLGTLLEAKGSLAAEDAALADFLEENGLRAAAAYCLSPGRGGLDRGRGDAPLTWRDPAAGDGTSFEEQILEPASLAAFERSGLIGLEAAAPAVDGRRPAAVPSGLDPAVAGGGAAYTHKVLPRHRGAVRRFFERSGSGEGAGG